MCLRNIWTAPKVLWPHQLNSRHNHKHSTVIHHRASGFSCFRGIVCDIFDCWFCKNEHFGRQGLSRFPNLYIKSFLLHARRTWESSFSTQSMNPMERDWKICQEWTRIKMPWRQCFRDIIWYLILIFSIEQTVLKKSFLTFQETYENQNVKDILGYLSTKYKSCHFKRLHFHFSGKGIGINNKM